MPKITVDNVELHYELRGEGQPLVLIGGLSTDLSIWNSVVDTLAKHYKILRFDNRSAGLSTMPAGQYTIADMAEDTFALMGALGIQKGHVIGHSLGSVIAQQIALRHPAAVDQLVLAGTFAQYPVLSRIAIESWGHMKSAKVDKALVAEAMLPWIFGQRFLSKARDVSVFVNAMLKMPNPQVSKGYLQQVNAIVSYDVTKDLARISAPTTVIVGQQDIMTPTREAKRVVDLIPNADLQVVTGVGHTLQVERPQVFTDVVLQLLAKNQSVSP